MNLGYDGLFPQQTTFFHVPPVANATRLVEQVKVPVLDPSNAEWVRYGTAMAVMLGFGWVCWKMFTGLASRQDGSEAKAKKAQ